MAQPTPESSAAVITAGTWRVDPVRSEIRFHTRKLGLIPVNGRFDQFEGELHIDDDGTIDGEITIEAASIRTGINKRDAHLRSQDFFHVDEYPQLIFHADHIAIGSSARVIGVLRIRDKDIAIEAPVSIKRSDEVLRVITDFPVDHHAAGLGWAKPGVIRKIMDAHVNLVLVPADPTED
jgi:polyisoprenoid-binding protein YceI